MKLKALLLKAINVLRNEEIKKEVSLFILINLTYKQ